MGTFKFKLAGGGGFTTPVAAVYAIKPHKKPGKAVVCVLWGRRHKLTSGGTSEVQDMVAVGDWKKLKARWMALKGAA